jgi:hypothetical protein
MNIYVRQSLYKPGQALRVPGVGGSKDTRKSALQSGKAVSLRHGRIYPHEEFGALICFRGGVDRRTHSAAVNQNPNNAPSNKPANFWLVVQWVNQLKYSLPQIIWTHCTLYLIKPSTLNVAQRYTHMHTAHIVQRKINRNCRSLAPLSGSSSKWPADNGLISSV